MNFHSNEIGSRSLGSFHDEENNFTKPASFDDVSSNSTTEKSKQVAKNAYGEPILMIEEKKEEQAEEEPVLLQYRSMAQESLKVSDPKRADSIKRRNVSLSLEKKFEVIMYKDANPEMSWMKIAEKLGVNKNIVYNLSQPAVRARITEAMKNPHLSKLRKLPPSQGGIKWHKKALKKNLPVPDSQLKRIKEEEEQKRRKNNDKPRTCVRNGRKRITLSEKLQYIKRWEEETAKNPEISLEKAARKMGLIGCTLMSMVKISDKIKRAMLIPETADMISIPREKLLRKMFEDAGVDFPPLPEPKPAPEGPADFWFTLSAGDISEVVTTTLSHCQFDQVEHARFVMNLRELVESTSGIVVPKDLPKFIPKTKEPRQLLEDEVVSCDEDEFDAE